MNNWRERKMRYQFWQRRKDLMSLQDKQSSARPNCIGDLTVMELENFESRVLRSRFIIQTYEPRGQRSTRALQMLDPMTRRWTAKQMWAVYRQTSSGLAANKHSNRVRRAKRMNAEEHTTHPSTMQSSRNQFGCIISLGRFISKVAQRPCVIHTGDP